MQKAERENPTAKKLLKVILKEIQELFEFFIVYMPGRLGSLIRSKYFSLFIECGSNLRLDIGLVMTGRKNIKFGHNVLINKYASIHADAGKLIIGDNFTLNRNSCISAADGGLIDIGDDVLIAQNVVLRASDHEHKSTSVPIRYQGHTGGYIIIGNGVWIGANCVITRNIKIGEHSIIAAGAVVTKDVESYSIVAGVPARLVKKRILEKN